MEARGRTLISCWKKIGKQQRDSLDVARDVANPASVVQAGYHRAQRFDRQTALQTSEKENRTFIDLYRSG